MGKRKKSSRKPDGPRKSEGLPTTFTCLFCNHEKAINIKLNKKSGVGELECKVCGQRFQCGINYLSAPVDVYGEWVDAADSVAKTEGDRPSDDLLGRPDPGRYASGRSGAGSSARRGGDHDDDGGDRRYEGEGIVGDDEYD